jgi:hypothetical protein
MLRSRVVPLALLVLTAACNGAGQRLVLTPVRAATAPSEAPGSTTAAACAPTGQDAFVYHPDRLKVVAACLRVTGTVAAIRDEADGDRQLLVAVDPPFAHLLTPANHNVGFGALLVETVCVDPTRLADPAASCAHDSHPLTGLPKVGQHVWMEGRYVLDEGHGGWAELHPLYRWGPD